MKGIESVINLKYYVRFMIKSTFQVCIYKVSIKFAIFETSLCLDICTPICQWLQTRSSPNNIMSSICNFSMKSGKYQ